MSIKCIIRSLKEPHTGKENVYPYVVNAPTINEEAFIDFVCTNRQLERAQVKAVLDGVSTSLGELLSLGHLVKVDGIGSFSVDVKGQLERDKRGVLQLKDAKVKSVKVKPSARLMKELGDCRFSLIHHDTIQPTNVNLDDARKAVADLLNEKPFFSSVELQRVIGSSSPHVLKLLKEMEQDHTLVRTRMGRGYVWMKP